MSIRKSVKARAPYNSQTFNDNNNYLVGQNGVLGGGRTSTSGSVVTIQPITFIQQGLIVSSDQPLTAALPATITAPYFVAVTSSSSIENLAEIITPTFVKRPEDISAGTVLVAEWDGQEWRQLPYLGMGSVPQAANQRAVQGRLVGVASGFDVTKDSSNIYVTSGSAIAADGSLILKNSATVLPKVATDVDSLDRIDEVVLRKPLDNPARTATLQYLVGSTFNAGGTFQTFAAQTASATSQLAPLVMNSTTSDALYIVVAEGTAPSLTLNFYTAATATSAPSLVGTLATGVDSFSALLTPDNFVDLVYVKGTSLYYQRISTVGASVYAETQIYLYTNTLTNPKMVTVSSGSSYFLHIAFSRRVSISQWQVAYMRLTTSNTVATQPQTLVDLSASLQNPSLAKDDDDSTIYLAFENQDTLAAYLYTFDASTPTLTSGPTQIGPAITLQDDTYYTNTATLLASVGATNPMVRRAANKETYVFWRHDKGSGVYGIAAWNANYINTFGHKAIVSDLYAPAEQVDSYFVSLDRLGTAHFLLRESGAANVANLRLTDLSVTMTGQLIASSCTDVRTIFNSRGSLVHSYGTSTPGAKIQKSVAGLGSTLRDVWIPPTDVYIAHSRKSDDALSVAGTAIEEDTTIRRLYEFNNIYAGTGTVTWGGTATHTLLIVSPITINFLDRKSTYTIPTNTPTGVTVPDGSVCYVNLPDDDTPSNLTLHILPFGKGTLDRYNRNIIPLFWSIGGVLYTKFAPFRVDSGGDTVIIGNELTPAERAWLGMPLNPDPSNHAYTSTFNITQSMNYNQAIAALDAAIGAGSSAAPAYFNGAFLVPNGATSYIVEFEDIPPVDTYRVIARLENPTDASALFQQVVVTQKDTGGFVAKWNIPTDSPNYVLTYFGISIDPNSGITALTNGATSQTISLPATKFGTSYRVNAMMQNLVDANPQFQPITVTAKTTTTFTVAWDIPLDSANYSLNFITIDSGSESQIQALTNNTQSVTINFGTPRLALDYSVFAQIENQTDSNPQFQTVTITNKTLTGYTASWNMPLDSSNYSLDTQVWERYGDTLVKLQVDQNALVTNRLPLITGAVVGTQAQVLNGLADYFSLTAAVTAASTGSKITILRGFTSTENVTIAKRLLIEGCGFDTHIIGIITLTSASSFSTIRGVYCNQFILNSGASGNQIVDAFWDADPLDSNALGVNRITGMHT